MVRMFFLWLFLGCSFISYASENCINKQLNEHSVFYQNSQHYDFSSYYCDYDDKKIINPAVLEIKGSDFSMTLKNVIGHRGMSDIGITNWNNKPAIYYSSGSSSRTEAYMTLLIKNKNVFVDCIYVNNRLKNLITTQYSFCGQNSAVIDGLDVEDIIPDFYLEPLFEVIDYSIVDDSSLNKVFDIFVGKIDDLSIYRRYLSHDDYMSEKYNVIVSSNDKQYELKNSNVYQRVTNTSNFIGLDVVTVNNDIIFYDKKSLLNILSTSVDKRDIKSYIQRNKTILYNHPNDKDSTTMYIVKGDVVSILDEYWGENNELWFKISYRSKKIGDIVKWIQGNAFNNF